MSDLSQAVAWHRQVAAMVAAADRAGVATADLPSIRARLLGQQSRLMSEAARVGAALPALVPTPSEIAAVGPALGDLSDAAVARAVRTISSTLDAADAALDILAPASTMPNREKGPDVLPGRSVPSTTGPTGPGPAAGSARAVRAVPRRTAVTWLRRAAPGTVAVRNVTVYGCFAGGVLTVQIGLFVLLDESTLALTGPLCLIVLPAFAWLAGYLTIGVAFRPPPGSAPVDRTPRLGAVVCAVPDAVLVAAVVLLFAVNVLKR